MAALSVSQKIFVARQINRLLRVTRRLVGRDMRVRCSRDGLNWTLDLNEGIDLSIYLLGAYEPRTIRAYRPYVCPGAIVFDIGANIGSHTLPLARLVGETGRVHAFEPTGFGLAKLRANLALNPPLAQRVTPEQLFLVPDRSTPPPTHLAASWPVAGQSTDLNAWSGRSLATEGATAITADDYCHRVGLTRLDLVKLDVDGHEWTVVQGFRTYLARYRPVIVVEIAPFIFEASSKADQFDEFINFFAALRYRFTDANTGRVVPETAAGLRQAIPWGGGINAILLPR